MKIISEQLRKDYKKYSNGGDLFTISHVGWLEERLMSTEESLSKGLADLRKEMGILITDPDSPEAEVIRTQWYFAKEIQKAYDTNTPPDIPKLMGLFGRMMEPPKREPIWPVPANVSELKGLLSDFYCWIENRYGPLVHNADIRYYVNEFLSVKARDEGK